MLTAANDARRAFIPGGHGSAWEGLKPAAAGFDPRKLEAAVALAVANDSPWPRSLYYPDGRYVGSVEWEETGPWSEIVGPVLPRGGPAGVILKSGYVVAEWGDTFRADMTFSVAKSYLSVLAGVAVANGLIANVDERVGATVKGPWFASPHNAAITWRHLLQQSSEWQGELWGKLDQVDHNRQVGVGADNSPQGPAPRAQSIRDLLRVQRRTRQPAGALPVAAFRQAATRGAARAGDGPDRSLQGLAMARV
jgi:hypothetical protein